MAKLSIIIPTLNSSCTIIRCLESIRCQEFADYEVFVQDAMSSDNTVNLITEFAGAHKQISVRVFQERDCGVYDAMNKAVARATGEWLYFLGSDDELYDENGLSKILNSPEARDADVLYGNVKMVKADEPVEEAAVYDGPFNLKKLLKKNICHQALLYRRTFMQEIGPYNIRYRVFADWDYNLHCWSRTNFRYVDVVLAVFNLGGISSCQNDSEFFDEIGRKVMDYFGWSMMNPLLNSRTFVGSGGIANMQRSASIFYFTVGNGLRLMSRVVGRVNKLLIERG